MASSLPPAKKLSIVEAQYRSIRTVEFACCPPTVKSGSDLEPANPLLGALRSPLPPFCQPDAPKHQGQPHSVIRRKGLAQDQDRKQRAKDRHQVDEQPSASWPDQLHPAHEQHLRNE